ncbi:MAG: hypothetical protein Q8P31_00735 [Bacillota bacterium]|nr:hypothetical protein [Bacillota bacterium]
MYRVRVNVSGHAREYFPAERLGAWIELSEPCPVARILAGWSVSPELVMAVFIDGVKAGLESVAPNGAEILIVTPPAGG